MPRKRNMSASSVGALPPHAPKKRRRARAVQCTSPHHVGNPGVWGVRDYNIEKRRLGHVKGTRLTLEQKRYLLYEFLDRDGNMTRLCTVRNPSACLTIQQNHFESFAEISSGVRHGLVTLACERARCTRLGEFEAMVKANHAPVPRAPSSRLLEKTHPFVVKCFNQWIPLMTASNPISGRTEFVCYAPSWERGATILAFDLPSCSLFSLQ